MDYCPNCGERLTGAARFCASCGAATTADPDQTRLVNEETRVAAPRPRAVEPRQVSPLASAPPAERRLEDPNQTEQVIFTVRPTLLFIKLGYALAALGGVALIALLAWQPWFSIPFLVSLPLALALLLLPAYRHLKRNMLRYTLTDSKIEISEGFIAQTTRNVLLRNVQDVTVTSTAWQRLLRFGNVVVDNAGAEGGVTVLRNIPDPRRHADILLRQLRRWR